MYVLTNSGEAEFLKRITEPTNVSNQRVYKIALFNSDITPAENDSYGLYSQPTKTGYVVQDLTGSNWTVSGVAPTTVIYNTEISFNFTSDAISEDIYGYFVYVETLGVPDVVLWAERFDDGPYNIPASGGNVLITPALGLN